MLDHGLSRAGGEVSIRGVNVQERRAAHSQTLPRCGEVQGVRARQLTRYGGVGGSLTMEPPPRSPPDSIFNASISGLTESNRAARPIRQP